MTSLEPLTLEGGRESLKLPMSNEPAELPLEIDVASVVGLRQSQADFLFLDCREADERALVKIDGTEFIPMGEVPGRLAELVPHQNRRVVIHCHHGGRSLRLARWLRQQGFSQAQSMRGGVDSWAIEVDPNLPRY